MSPDFFREGEKLIFFYLCLIDMKFHFGSAVPISISILGYSPLSDEEIVNQFRKLTINIQTVLIPKFHNPNIN